MQAAILLAPSNFVVSEIPDPECPSGGVVIQVKVCGICSSDVKMVTKGHRALMYPRVLGHEIVGIVVESQSSHFTIGDRVQVAPGLCCKLCRECQRGMDNQCFSREIFGFSRDGGFAEYLPVPLDGAVVGTLTKLPENVSFALAALAEPLACCLNAQEKIGVREGDVVLIIGAGPLGLLHAGVARSLGASTILFSEIDVRRRQQLVPRWADLVIDPVKEDLASVVMDITAGQGVDVLLLAAGSNCNLDKNFLNFIRRGGRVSVFSGLSTEYSQIEVDLNLLHYKEIFLSGAYGCAVCHNRAAITFLADAGQYFTELISHRFSLLETVIGIEMVKNKEVFKAIVEVER